MPDTQLVNSQIHKIGMLQEEIEKSSIRMFQELNKICTPEQKEKLLTCLRTLHVPRPKGGYGSKISPHASLREDRLKGKTHEESLTSPAMRFFAFR